MNRRLLDKKVLIQWEKPWDLLAERNESSGWLGIVNTLRTIYFKDIISHTPEIKTFKEQYSF